MFVLSIWQHPFTAVDALMNKWCNAKFLQICSGEETNSSTSTISHSLLFYILTRCETLPHTDFAQVDRADSPSQASLLRKHLVKQL